MVRRFAIGLVSFLLIGAIFLAGSIRIPLTLVAHDLTPHHAVPHQQRSAAGSLHDLRGHIYFARGSFIWTMNANGSDVHRPSSTGAIKWGLHMRDSHPAISPDGRWVAYRNSSDKGGLYVVSITGRRTHLACKPFNAADIAWSPDSRTLAFTFVAGIRSGRNRAIVTTELGTCQADGSSLGSANRNHPENSYTAVLSDKPQIHPVWSDDGQRVIEDYSPTHSGVKWQWEPISVGVRATTRTVLLREKNVIVLPHDASYNDLFLTYSHDRRLLAFMRVVPGQKYGALVVEDRRERAYHTLRSNMPVEPLCFSPDGRYIGFMERGALYAVPVFGGIPRFIAANVSDPSWGP